MNWLRRWEIARLKRRAGRAMLTMDAIVDSMDCGHHLAGFISRDYTRAQVRYMNAMARLKEIDPTCPFTWEEITRKGHIA